ncbi:uncharacterized protein RB166_012482 [Leptodactylus fuscus]|uniref:uncharacterized protein LOC142209906 n=1 Tax=Leptodactylus fuscus TaxID=238119 RepID=UPI003F4E9F8A
MKASYICILAVLVTSAASDDPTECSSCWNIGQTECCPTKSVKCPSGVCMTVSEHCILNGQHHKTITKMCGDKTSCNGCFSVTTEQGLTVRVSSQCSTGNHSNDGHCYGIGCESLEKKNGHQCDACYSNSTMDGCIPTGKVMCSGSELDCVTFRGIIQVSDHTVQQVSVKGCITKGGCALGFGAMPGAKSMKELELACTAAEKVPIEKED